MPTLLNSFENSHVEDDKIFLHIDGHIASVDEDYFAQLFQLQREGIYSFVNVSAADLAEVQMLVSASAKPFKISDSKTNMKFEYQILTDIVVKGILVKAGSFAIATMKKFQILTDILRELLSTGRMCFLEFLRI